MDTGKQKPEPTLCENPAAILGYCEPGTTNAIGPARSAWQRIPVTVKCAALIALCLPAGYALGTSKSGHSSILVPVVWAAGGIYVAARVCESRPLGLIALMKLFAAVSAVLLAPFLLCEDSLDSCPLNALQVYGWNSNALGNGGRAAFLLLAALLTLVGVADLVPGISRIGQRLAKPNK